MRPVSAKCSRYRRALGRDSTVARTRTPRGRPGARAAPAQFRRLLPQPLRQAAHTLRGRPPKTSSTSCLPAADRSRACAASAAANPSAVAGPAGPRKGVMRRPTPHRGANGADLPRGRDRHDVGVRGGRIGAQLAQYRDAVRAGRVDLRQHEAGAQVTDRAQGIGSGVRGTDDLEALRPLPVSAMGLGHHEVVVNGQHPDHGADRGPGPTGSRAVHTAPASLWTPAEPPRPVRLRRVIAGPRPRLPPCSVNPWTKTSVAGSGATPGPESRTATETSSGCCRIPRPYLHAGIPFFAGVGRTRSAARWWTCCCCSSPA